MVMDMDADMYPVLWRRLRLRIPTRENCAIERALRRNGALVKMVGLRWPRCRALKGNESDRVWYIGNRRTHIRSTENGSVEKVEEHRQWRYTARQKV
jgi:hypothetical protein